MWLTCSHRGLDLSLLVEHSNIPNLLHSAIYRTYLPIISTPYPIPSPPFNVFTYHQQSQFCSRITLMAASGSYWSVKKKQKRQLHQVLPLNLRLFIAISQKFFFLPISQCLNWWMLNWNRLRKKYTRMIFLIMAVSYSIEFHNHDTLAQRASPKKLKEELSTSSSKQFFGKGYSAQRLSKEPVVTETTFLRGIHRLAEFLRNWKSEFFVPEILEFS